jgi:polyhydroxyalkanoate synthase
LYTPVALPPLKARAPAAAAGEPFKALHALDHLREAMVAMVTFGLSPESLLLAWTDWAMHLAGAPGKRTELALRIAQAAPALLNPAPGRQGRQDPRFAGAAWQQEPYAQWARAFGLCEDWWRSATRDVPGTEPHHAQVVSFVARQWLDMLAPSNQPWSNPEVRERTLREGGMNLGRGALHFLHDLQRKASAMPPVGSDDFVVGGNLACTPGKVVMHNHLVELIQYSPTTATVHAEPVLLAGGQGPHGVLSVLAQRDRGRSRPDTGRLPPPGPDGGTRCHSNHSARAQGACTGLLSGRYLAGHCRGSDGARRG